MQAICAHNPCTTQSPARMLPSHALCRAQSLRTSTSGSSLAGKVYALPDDFSVGSSVAASPVAADGKNRSPTDNLACRRSGSVSLLAAAADAAGKARLSVAKATGSRSGSAGPSGAVGAGVGTAGPSTAEADARRSGSTPPGADSASGGNWRFSAPMGPAVGQALLHVVRPPAAASKAAAGSVEPGSPLAPVTP